MPDAIAADPSERLPWLPNAAPPPRPKARSLVPLIGLAGIAVALAVAFWSVLQRESAPEPVAPPTRTIALPPPTVAPEAAAEPQAPSVSEREALRPTAKPTATERPKRRSVTASPRRPAKAAPDPQPAAAVPVPTYSPRAWNSGVRGRIIQLGAFATSAQANGEWKRVYYRYPLLRPLPPRVVKTKIRNRTYYRLQLGTFSQAHSELLCQRLRATGQGCIVLGLRGR